MKAQALRNVEELSEFGATIDVALAPHSIYMASEALLRWVGELAAERGVAFHIHLSETEREVNECIERHGERPAAYLDRLGALGKRTVLAHGVWLDEAELELIAARGATVVTNPVANMKLAVGGFFPYRGARRAGVAIGLSTDGAGSNDSLDLLADLKVFALTQRHGGAASLAPGAPADFLLLRGNSPELGIGELASDLVYAASGAVVDTTVVAGLVLMRGGEVEGTGEIIARVRERARRLGLA